MFIYPSIIEEENVLNHKNFLFLNNKALIIKILREISKFKIKS